MYSYPTPINFKYQFYKVHPDSNKLKTPHKFMKKKNFQTFVFQSHLAALKFKAW